MTIFLTSHKYCSISEVVNVKSAAEVSLVHLKFIIKIHVVGTSYAQIYTCSYYSYTAIARIK